MSSSQLLLSDFALPSGYILQGYTISRILVEDAYSLSYLAVDNVQQTEVVLVEYLPRSLAQRDQDTYHIKPKSIDSKKEYEWGLSHYLSDADDLVGINHPNIVNVRTCFKALNTVYMVTDRIAGVTLDSYVQDVKDKKLSESEVRSLLIPLLDGLHTIHSAGHIHSDLTPFNILITGDSRKPVITELGNASHLFRHHMNEITLTVSPGYSPYELYYANDKQGEWTDIYAMGCILYRLISGSTPDSSASRLTGIADHNQDPLVSVFRIMAKAENTVYSKQLLSAIDHAIQLRKIDRPQTVSQWCDELGIQTNAVVKINDTSAASTGDLRISGLSVSTDVVSSNERTGVDFNGLTQLHYAERESKFKPYALISTVVTALLVTLVGSYFYFTQSETADKLAFEVQQKLTVPVETSSSEESLDVSGLLNPSSGKVILLSQQIKVEPVAITTFSNIIQGGNRFDTAIQYRHVITLRDIIRTNNVLPSVQIIAVNNSTDMAIRKTEEGSTSAEKTANGTKSQNQQRLNITKVTKKNRNVKTRQQYQREWVAKQKRKNVPKKKTKEQYQKEWAVKQSKLRKRAEWKKRKEHLKKVKTRKTTEALEKGFLADSEW